jgi:hypothetical protein
MNNIALIHAILKQILEVAVVIFLYVKWHDIKQIFCEKDGGMSSKRVISIMGMFTLCRLAMYVTKADCAIDGNILLVLTIIILTASAIATFPQILDLVGKIKSIGSKPDKKESEPETK